MAGTYRLPLGGGVFGHASFFPADVRADGDEILGDLHVGEVLNVIAWRRGGVSERD